MRAEKDFLFSTSSLGPSICILFFRAHAPWSHCPFDSVGLMSAWRLRGARFVSVEAQEVSAGLARKSVKFNGLEERYDVRVGDLRDERILGDEEFFDLITGTPPYFPTNSVAEESKLHPQKQACRFEIRGTVADYCQTAAK